MALSKTRMDAIHKVKTHVWRLAHSPHQMNGFNQNEITTGLYFSWPILDSESLCPSSVARRILYTNCISFLYPIKVDWNEIYFQCVDPRVTKSTTRNEYTKKKVQLNSTSAWSSHLHEYHSPVWKTSMFEMGYKNAERRDELNVEAGAKTGSVPF